MHRPALRHVPRRAAAATFAASLLVLAGCRSGYTVDVENASARPVSVRLLQDQVATDSKLLASDRLAPGQRTTLGPAKAVFTDSVVLMIEDLGETGMPPHKVKLEAGTTKITVTPANERTAGSFGVTKDR